MHVPEPDWSNAERFSDLHYDDQGEIECPECKEIFDVLIEGDGTSCSVTFVAHPDSHINADIPFYTPDEDWDNFSIPDNPFDIFIASYVETEELLEDRNDPATDSLINRLLFTQFITAMEAYLGDTLIKKVKDDIHARARLIRGDTQLKNLKFGLADIAEDPDIIDNSVQKRLREISYHNLKHVNALYKEAIKFDLLPNSDESGRLFDMVAVRHHCVHRNGYDESGNKIHRFSKHEVMEAGALIRAFISRINDDLWPSPF